MNNWKETTLGEVADIQTGPFGSQLHESDYVVSGTPIITVEHLANDRITHSRAIPQVSEADTMRLKKRYALSEGDIVFSRVGSVDRSAYVTRAEEGWLFSGRLLRVRPKSGAVDGRWLDYWLRQDRIKEFVRKNAVGATMPSINTNILCSVPLGIMTLEKQKQIAAVLLSLDDKIELLRKENETLEKIAQTIFKEWFVNFTIDGKKLKLENGIPEGWRISAMNTVFDQIIRGFTTKYVSKSNLINLNQKVNKGENLEHQHYKYYPEDITVPSEKFAHYGDILVNSLGEGTLGRVHFYTENSRNVVIDQHISILRNTSSKIYREYAYLYLKSNNKKLMDLVTGTTGMLMLNINQIRSLEILLPSRDILDKFHNFCSDVFEKKSNNNSQIQTLSRLRDTLLPKLMGGEVRIK